MYAQFFFYVVDNLQYCQTIKITLKNEVLTHCGQCQGTYEKSASVNGKPSWTSQSKALWYNPSGDKWMIGNQKNIGTRRGFMFTYGMPLGSKDGKYSDGKIWKRLDQTDFSIECNKYNQALTSEGNYQLSPYVISPGNPVKNP